MVQLYLMLESVKDKFRRDEGVTAVEYALIAALIAVAIIGAVTFLGGKVGDTFNKVGGSVGSGT